MLLVTQELSDVFLFNSFCLDHRILDLTLNIVCQQIFFNHSIYDQINLMIVASDMWYN